MASVSWDTTVIMGIPVISSDILSVDKLFVGLSLVYSRDGWREPGVIGSSAGL